MPVEPWLSVVIPVYGSEGYLAKTVQDLIAYLDARVSFEVVLVNDGSPDGVSRVIDALCSGDQRVRAATLGHNIGQHRATLRGFSMARGEVVVTVDDDGQNPPESAMAVADALWRGNFDVVYGRFESVEQTLSRRLASRVNRWLSRRTIQNWSDIAITNVRAIRGDLARSLGGVESPYPYIDALIFRMTRHIGEVPVKHLARQDGRSTYTLPKLFRLWVSHLTSLTILPLQAAMVGSFTVSALGFVLGVGQTMRVLIERQAPSGWLSLFVTVTFLFSILFAFMGIISAYLGRMFISLNERGLVWIRKNHSVPAPPEVGKAPPAARTG